jgi:predicted glycosyltransferase
MKILLYFGHPAQYLFLRETIRRLISKGFQVKILIKTKDVLENLLILDGFEYTNILPEERGKSKLAIAYSLLKRNLVLFPILLRFKPNLVVGTDASIAQMGKLFNINRITITEDDYAVIKTLGDLTYPFTQTILCPKVCSVGKWDAKKIGYAGYMKLGYLHPNVFSQDKKIIEEYKLKKDYVIIRLAKLTAHHDFGIKGISYDFLEKLISIIEGKSMQVYISSEGALDDNYKKYLLKINPKDMHHVLSFASLLICDSQSMSVEAAMLGVPSLRYSSFSGRISVLEELEHNYGLTFGINPEYPERLISKLEELLAVSNLRGEFQLRKEKMLADKIDVTAFLVWFIENYPSSVKKMKVNPDYQNRFK